MRPITVHRLMIALLVCALLLPFRPAAASAAQPYTDPDDLYTIDLPASLTEDTTLVYEDLGDDSLDGLVTSGSTAILTASMRPVWECFSC